ncbi:kinesin-like protein Klp61F [Cotesia glomerata]|nr:kinesin-like protein Klp61F [Cotesia glomerata]
MSEFSNRSKKDKNQHIQVFVRVRPSNQSESCGKSFTVIDVPSYKEVLVRERPQDKVTKKFTFDRVFGPKSKQLDVYTAVVNPFVAEVLAGYNCTVFAYGQTGTGKTYTMEGAGSDPAASWQTNSDAGIIPRALSNLFDDLRLGTQEYTVKVSFLELYNEELFDLLSSHEDASKLKLFEDSTKKGSVIIQGLEEVIVHNKDEVYKILQRGSEKRQTAATLMNASSSRSHTVFSITVHMKECSVEGEELIKTGKLNLVDLAGSENVGRSGAVDKRAREAGNINQSLLTLGRVITALVERGPHIPYRESKLTRLLQDSLGGRTKTSIIATISPSSLNLEETLSTLDYAHRAKNITNRPEINQKLTKATLIKEYTEEIERLKRDLLATRERNGVYLSSEDYDRLVANNTSQGKEIEEKIQFIKVLQEELESKSKLFEKVSYKLEKTCLKVKIIKQDRDEQKYLVDNLEKIKESLSNQAQTLLQVADTATDHTNRLHDKIARKNKVEDQNDQLCKSFVSRISESLKELITDVNKYSSEVIKESKDIKELIFEHSDGYKKNLEGFVEKKEKDLEKSEGNLKEFEEVMSFNAGNYKSLFENIVLSAREIDEEEKKKLINVSEHFANEIKRLVNNQIAENLASVEKDLQNKLRSLRQQLQVTVTDLYLTMNEKMNLVGNKLANLEEQLKIREDCNEVNKNKEEKFDELMKEMMANYLELRKGIRSDREKDSEVCKVWLGELEIVKKEVKEVCEKHEGLKSFVDSEVTNNVKGIQEVIGESVKVNCGIAKETINGGEKLAEKFKSLLSDASQIVSDYREKVEEKMIKAGELVEKDKNGLKEKVEGFKGVLKEDLEEDRGLIKEYKEEVLEMSREVGKSVEEVERKVEGQKEGLVGNVEKIEGSLKRFFEEEVKKDTPTGATPVKKDFEYPRKIVEMSPRERIVEKFRKWREEHPEEENEEEDDNEELDVTLASNLNETEVVPPTPVQRSRSFDKVKEIGTKLFTARSEQQINLELSDFQRSSLTSGENSSDEFICNNKENGKKRSGDKRISKQPKFVPRKYSKKVLTSHND